ncbi:MAG TPA: AAA family ATPase [Solirubrobacteraceae bacterium]|nr:AAA family ATPase [Solirubrobacteraceae bacterium]
MLLERSNELNVLRAAIADARAGAGRLVLIEGPAGIGKTALLAQAREASADAGLQVLSARGHELEHEFAFGVARQLFELPVARADLDLQDQLLSGAAGITRPLLTLERRRDGRADASPSRPSRPASDIGFTISHGFYWLTANLAETGPLLLALDDAQFADRSSLQCIAYLAGRCQELPVLLVLTIRSDESSASDQLLAALRTAADATIVTPRTLSQDGVAQLVRERLGGGADPKFCSACASVTGGNPFLLGELLTELEAEQVPATAATAARVERASPESVRRVVLGRLERLGPDAIALAQAVAILERATLRDAGELARLDPAATVAAADDLLAAEILTAEPLAFLHPLLRVAVYEQIPPAGRADDHRRAALLLAASGASTLRVGAHLLRASPNGDSHVVGLLGKAAAEAFAGGDLNAALALLRRALAEPPDEAARGTVLGQLGQMEALAHEPASVEHLTEALALTAAPAARVAIASALGEALVWGGGHSVRAYEMLSRVLNELGPDLAPPLRATLETLRTATASVDVRLASKVSERRADLRALADAAGPAGRGLKIFDACWSAQTEGVGSHWRERLEEGLDGGRFVAEQTGGSPIVIYAALVLVLSDDVEHARALLADIRADARSRGSIVSHLVDLAWGAHLCLRTGEVPTAISDAEAALALARRIDARWVEVWMLACLCQALSERGELDAAADLIESVPLDRAFGTAAGLHALLARARVRMARGDREGAIEDLWLAGENVIINNPSFLPWRSTLATILAPTDPHRARDLAESELERARELGQPRGIGVALRARGRLVGGTDGLPLLEESVETLRSSPARLELARSLIELGSTLRRTGRRAAAREPLREALALAQRCGAEVLIEIARQELTVSGARPRREVLAGPEALTPSEWRVAELAASGLQNREIAQALFVTTKTVGTHLAHIYQKLGLSGQQARESLADRLQADSSPV